MAKSGMIRIEDAKAILRLANKLHDGLQTRDVLAVTAMESLRVILGSHFAVAVQYSCPLDARRFSVDWATTSGELDREGRNALMVRLPKANTPGPILSIIQEGRNIRRVSTREEVITDADWYGTSFYENYIQPANLGHGIVAVHPLCGPGRSMAMTYYRPPRERPFNKRERNILDLYHSEMQWFYEKLAVSSATKSSMHQLSPQLRRVLTELLAGKSEKQIARALQLSIHTVHSYMKLLHRKLGVSSRTELVLRCTV